MQTRFQRPTAVGALAIWLFSFGPSPLASAQGVLLDFEILYEIDGDSQGDLLGASTAGIGDIDGDGRGDFVVGIQREDPGGVPNAGTARVFSGADGSILFTFEGVTPGGALGNDVSGAGDVNGDGVPDIIVGAIFDDRNGFNQAGSATVYSGADGSVLYSFAGAENQALVGRAVAGAGDVDGDGYADVIVGQTDNRNGVDAGSIQVYSGADGSLLYDILGAAATDAFGASVAGLGDLDGDGFDDFAAGARHADVSFADAGQVRIFSGQTGALLFVYDGAAADAILHVVAAAGDVDGDGTPDVLIGSPGVDHAAVYSGADGALIYSFLGNSPGDGFGSRLAGLGDVDHDGSSDVIVAAPSDDRNGIAAGSVTVYSGTDGSVLFTLDGDPGDQLGSGVGGLGDVNGDPCLDFIVGAFFDDNNFTNSGSAKILVFSGAVCNPDTAPPQVTIVAPEEGDVFGTTSVLLQANIVDDSPTVVGTSPVTLATPLPAGGGSVNVLVPLLVEGDNDLVVTAADAAGNVGGTAMTVLRDTISPAITLAFPPTGAILAATPASVTIRIDDATATSIAFGPHVIQAPRGGGLVSGLVDLQEGDNVLVVSVVDEAGNSSSLNVNLLLDLSAPLTSIDTPADGSCFGPGEETVAVSATVDDLTATVIQSNTMGMADSLPAGGGILTGTYVLAEGYNDVSVVATDATGRAGSAHASVLLDTTGPTVALPTLDPAVPVAGDVDLGATALDVLPGTGISSVEFFVDGDSIALLSARPFETIFDTRSVSDGLHTFRVVGTDGKGNSSAAEVTVSVDNTAPQVFIQAPFDGAFVMGDVPLEVFASDAGSGVLGVTVLAGAQSPTDDPSIELTSPQGTLFVAGSQDTVPLPDGSLVLRAIARDAAGNEAVAQITVEVDNTAPEKFLVTPSDDDWVSGTIDITADGSDANLDRIEIYVGRDLIGSSVTAPFTVSFDTSTLLDGALTVTAVAYDQAGNVSNCSARVVVDNMDFSLTPKTLNLKSKGNDVVARVDGSNVGMLFPVEGRQIELCVPGGSPVRAESGGGGSNQIRFDRRTFAQSIRAGIAAGQIEGDDPTVEVSLKVDGRLLGTTLLRVKS